MEVNYMSWKVILPSEKCGYRRKTLFTGVKCLHPDNKGEATIGSPPCDKKFCPVLANSD